MAEAAPVHLLVDIALAEDGFAEDAEMGLRDRLVDAIESRGIGEVGGFGSGAGSMDISVIVEDEAVGRERVTSLLGEMAPRACRSPLRSSPTRKPPTNQTFQRTGRAPRSS